MSVMNQAVSVITAGTRTAGGSAVFNTKFVEAMDLRLTVTAVAGTAPTLDLAVSYVDPVSSAVVTLVSFTQANGATVETKSLPAMLPEEITLTWTIGGTGSPSVTFGVSGLRKIRMK